MRVLGTAGHVDHGKSTLVEALTGIHPDRLKEEQERQMTIDLGFAWLTLPSGEEVGIVDVPGHRDFIENMLAGVGGLDAALLVVAADEGVMPQTREHLAILDLLGVNQGVVALSKTDLVDDEEWLDFVTQEIRDLLRSTSLEGSPIVPLSAVQGIGLEALILALGEALSEAAPRKDLRKPRLPIDRAFTIAGFGTVVTGTLVDGSLELGLEVEVLPAGHRGRVRGLQTHKTPVERATPGSRVAANLSGIEAKQIGRGDVLALPGSYQTTDLLDVGFRLLPDAAAEIRHNQTVKLFIGASQRMARVRLLEAERIKPGESGWLQLSLSGPVVASRGDRFILRRASPGATLGGGQVAEPHPARRHKRKDKRVVERLEQLLEGEASSILLHALSVTGPMALGAAVERSGLETEEAAAAAQALLEQGQMHDLSGIPGSDPLRRLVVADAAWWRLREQVEGSLKTYHRQHPHRIGMPREELKSRLGLEGKAFNALIGAFERAGIIASEGNRVRLAEFRVELSADEQHRLDRLLKRFEEMPFAPPSPKECAQAVGEELLGYLLDSGALIKLSKDVVLRSRVFEEMAARVREEIGARGQITVAQVRDLFDTSRKYALALMEYLDSEGVTYREGDVRKLIGT